MWPSWHRYATLSRYAGAKPSFLHGASVSCSCVVAARGDRELAAAARGRDQIARQLEFPCTLVAWTGTDATSTPP